MVHFYITKHTHAKLLNVTFWSFALRGMLHLLAFIADPVVFQLLPKLLVPSSRHSNEDYLGLEARTSKVDIAFDMLDHPSNIESDSPDISKMAKEFQQFI
ncbi:hypothetical protein DSO57_1036723 [Entomophthora muscae]|uniref:Uncharacterized protein n=1 Tax=Entomophthora muscae TaxID=34485 RepID=A0ACC2TLM3_9FUNG|nr:hypothetical protein DSO57_1036723 [Entomophthora muscae]